LDLHASAPDLHASEADLLLVLLNLSLLAVLHGLPERLEPLGDVGDAAAEIAGGLQLGGPERPPDEKSIYAEPLAPAMRSVEERNIILKCLE